MVQPQQEPPDRGTRATVLKRRACHPVRAGRRVILVTDAAGLTPVPSVDGPSDRPATPYWSTELAKALVDAVCLSCECAFKHNPKKTHGRFCSNKCFQDFRRKNKLEAWIAGAVIGPKAARNLLISIAPFCELCGIGQEWQGLPLSLHMDHINGDSDYNGFVNVRLLCPNCHSQTDTYGVKNSGSESSRVRYMRKYKA